MELLSDADLRGMCKAFKIPLHYIGYKDTFSKITPKDGAYIVNLDSQINNRGGTHWTALFLKNKQAIYFDPFGLTVPLPTRNFITRYKPTKILFSTRQIQQMDSELCGYFVFYFLYFFSNLHKNNNNLEYLVAKHNRIYVQQNRKLNDLIIQKLMKLLIAANPRLR